MNNEKKYVNALVLLCSVVYFISYLTRINYAAVLIEIVKSRGISNAEASLALTASAVSYGGGQLVSGYFGDRIKPQKIVLTGLVCTTLMNILLPVFTSTASSVIIWTVNGFAQAMMWPPIVKILTNKMSGEVYQKACVYVSWGASFATIFVYLIAPVIIHSFSWKAVFTFSGIAALIMSIVWGLTFNRINNKISDATQEASGGTAAPKEKITGRVVLLLGLLMLVIVIQGSLRDGISTWTPTYVSEMFNFGSEVSILSGVILPVFSIMCHYTAMVINRRLIKNQMANAGVIFAAAAVFSAILSFFGEKSAVLAIASLAIVTGCMHGINYLMTCLTPSFFVKYGKVSFISGLLNSCTYVGSAVSTYGIALMTNDKSWSFISGMWGVVAFIGAALCIIASVPWGKFTKRGILN